MRASHSLSLVGAVVGAWLSVSIAAPAQGLEAATNTATPVGVLRDVIGTNSLPVNKVPAALAREDVYGHVAGPLLKSLVDQIKGNSTNNAFLGFLSDWHLRPKVFQAHGGSAGDASLGLEFDYQRSLAHATLSEASAHPLGLALSIAAKGDVAFQASKNPNNLLETSAGLHLFQGLGGVAPVDLAEGNAEAVAADKKAAMERQQKLLDLAGNKDPEARRKCGAEFSEYIRPQFFYDIQGQGSYETDQQFENRQWAYGAKASFVFRDWRAKSDIGWFNLFDYPFAAIRALTDQVPFQPSGRTFPSVAAGIDMVDPTDNGMRLALDPNADTYPRVRVEVAFKTPIIRWGSDRLYFSATYRHYQEIDASEAIKTAELDRSDYFVAQLDLPYHFNISYSTGKLPLDQKNNQVYAVGWTLNF